MFFSKDVDPGCRHAQRCVCVCACVCLCCVPFDVTLQIDCIVISVSMATNVPVQTRKLCSKTQVSLELDQLSNSTLQTKQNMRSHNSSQFNHATKTAHTLCVRYMDSGYTEHIACWHTALLIPAAVMTDWRAANSVTVGAMVIGVCTLSNLCKLTPWVRANSVWGMQSGIF